MWGRSHGAVLTRAQMGDSGRGPARTTGLPRLRGCPGGIGSRLGLCSMCCCCILAPAQPIWPLFGLYGQRDRGPGAPEKALESAVCRYRDNERVPRFQDTIRAPASCNAQRWLRCNTTTFRNTVPEGKAKIASLHAPPHWHPDVEFDCSCNRRVLAVWCHGLGQLRAGKYPRAAAAVGGEYWESTEYSLRVRDSKRDLGMGRWGGSPG